MGDKKMKRLTLLFLCSVVLSFPAFAEDYPDKCRNGYIIKRDLFSSSGTTSPLRRKDRRYEENKMNVTINNGKYKYSYKHCWSDGECSWIDTNWSTLGKSSHGQAHTRDGYSAFMGTMSGANSFYVCWFKE